MSRYWLTAERAMIALGVLVILALFSFTRFVATNDPEAVAAVLGSTELADGPGQDRTPSASSGSADDGPDRSTGAIPAPIGPTTIASVADEAIAGTSPEAESEVTAPDTSAPTEDDPPAKDAPEGPDDTPDTTVPPAEPSPDEPDDNPDGDGPDREEEESPEPDDDDPPEEEEQEEPEEDLSNNAPTVWLTWSGYTLGGLIGQTTNPVTFVAGDPDGDPLTFSATGLPPGLTIDQISGTITGSFISPCICQVTIIVSDGRGGVGTVGFGWTVV